jgi:hypothetical protein
VTLWRLRLLAALDGVGRSPDQVVASTLGHSAPCNVVPIGPMPIPVPIHPGSPAPAMGPDATGMGPRQRLTHGRKAVFGPLGTVTMPKDYRGSIPIIIRVFRLRMIRT